MKQYETILRNDNLIIFGHKINQIGVLPGVALIDFVYRTLQSLVPIEDISLNNCLFHEAISFQHASEKRLRLTFDDTVRPNKVSAYTVDANQIGLSENKGVLNFECDFIPSKNQNLKKTIDIENLRQNSTHLGSLNQMYDGLKKVGIVHDDFMQVEGEIYQSKQFILFELALSKRASTYLDKFVLHPAMLDAATIGSILPIYQEIRASNHAYIPISLGAFSCIKKLPSQCYMLIDKQDVIYLEDIMKASFSIYATNGELLAEFRNLVNKKIRSGLNQTRVNIERKEQPQDDNIHVKGQQVLLNLLNDYLPEPITINETENFYNLGLDSQALIAIVHKLEKITGEQLYPTLLFEYNNLQKLNQYLSQYFPDFGSYIEQSVEPKQTIDFLMPRWMEVEQSGINNHDLQLANIKELLVFSDDTVKVEQLKTNPEIIHAQIRIIHIHQASEYWMLDENTYQVNLQNEQELQRLLDALWAQGIMPNNIIYCDSKWQSGELTSLFQVALFLKNLQKINVKSIRYLHSYAYDENSINSGCILVPYFKSLKLEEPSFNFQVIGLQDLISENYLEDLFFRFFIKFETANYRLSGKKCYELNYGVLIESRLSNNDIFEKHSRTFIITGGAGKIGLAIANYLVEQRNATIYLLGRSPAEGVSALKNLSNIFYFSCDISNKKELELFSRQLQGQTIDAVIHCAGVLKDALHENTEQAVFTQILKPKWQGTINSYELCTELKIPFLFLFSSLTSVLGNIGQTQYASANAYLDEFARVASLKHQSNPNLPHVVSINWPLWQEGGMINAKAKQILEDKWGLAPLSTEMAFHCLKVASSKIYSQIVVSNDLIKTYLKTKSIALQDKENCVTNKILGNNEDSDIAIIGLAGRYPMAKDLDEFWLNLCAAKDCVSNTASKRFASSVYQFGGFLDDIDKFDPLFFGVSPKDAKIMDPQERLFLQTAWHTFEDAGYGKVARSQYESIGVFVGAMFSLYQINGLLLQNQQKTQLANSSFASIANRVSYCLDLNGPSLTLDTMCSSSLTTLHYACESIKSGECQLALVGGVNLISHQSKYDELLQRGFLSKEGRCKVFNAGADGYVPGEGVGAILIKRLAEALKDHDHIYGIIKGSAINHSGKSDGYTVPNMEYQSKLLCSVLDKTKIHPASLSYFEAHGTGTALGDPIELKAITNAYKSHHNKKNYCAIGSVKSNIGHLESAAGIAGLTKILLQFKHKKLVPSIHANPLNPGININDSPCFIQDKLADWEVSEFPRRAAISGFGAGGTNVHCILEEYQVEKKEPVKDQDAHLFLFSAKTANALTRLMTNFQQWLTHLEEDIDIQALSLTLALGRDHFQHRLAIVANSIFTLRAQLVSQVKSPIDTPRLDSITNVEEASLESLAYYYQIGEEIDWTRIYAKQIWCKKSLPLYPFEEESYWVGDSIYQEEIVGSPDFLPLNRKNHETNPSSRDHDAGSRDGQLSLNFYAYKWLRSKQDFVLNKPFEPTQSTKFLIVDLDPSRYEILKTKCFGDNLVLITQGNEVKRLSANHYEFNLKNLQQCQFCIQEIFAIEPYQQAVILHFLSDKSIHENTVDDYEREFENAFLSLHFLCQVLLRSSLDIPVEIKYVYRSSSSRPVCASVSAYLKTLMRENTRFSGQVIKLDEQNDPAFLVDVIKTELTTENVKAVDIAYSFGLRSYKTYEVVSEFNAIPYGKSFVEKNGVYLIVGGLGKLGLIIANYLASVEKVHLVLVGRKEVDEAYLRHHLTLEKTGSETVYYSCDVAQYDAVMALITKIKLTHKKINGIINSSSSLKFSPVSNKSVDEILDTLGTKCAGTNHLDLATRDEQLDWFVCFSSLASVIGFPEGCDYAFGNAYLDEFVEKRNQLVRQGKRSGRTIAFNWSVWQDGGMIKKNAETQQSWEDWMIKSQGVIPMSRERGLEAFELVMQSSFSQIIIADGYDHLIQKTLNAGFRQTASDLGPVIKTNLPLQQQKIVAFSVLEVEAILIDTISELLELPKNKIDIQMVFTDFGFDSMSLITLSERLTQRLKIEILPSLFFSENSIHKLTRHLIDYYEPREIPSTEKKPIASGLEYAFTEQQRPIKNKQNSIIENRDLDDIAIVGMDGKFPNSDSLDLFWQNLINGVDLISEIPADRWNWQDYYQSQPEANQSHSKWGGFLPNIQSFDARFFKISDTEAEMMDPQHRLFLEVAWRAIENAGQAPEALQGKSIGVFVGVQFNDYQNNLFADQQTNFYIATGNSHALIANRLSHLLDLSGPSEAIDTACSSALVALNRAVNAIKLGECESAIVGATTCILNPMSYVVTSQLGIISPEGRCKVFDAAANGYVKGEGTGVLWLMPLKMAKAQNYPIHGLIKGIGVNHGGKSTSLTAPNIKAQQQLLVNTYTKSKVPMDTISFIETHGTGTLLGDSIEIESIKAAFHELASSETRLTEDLRCSLGSVKSNAGHLEPAAGIIGLIKVLLMFKHAIKVQNLQFNSLSPYIKLENSRFKIQEESEVWVSRTDAKGEILPKRAAVSSFGFGGTNAHVILEEFVQAESQTQNNKPYYLCALSAKTESALFRRIHELAHYLSTNPTEGIETISYTLNVGRTHYQYRCAIVAENVSVLEKALNTIGINEVQNNVFFSANNHQEAISPLHHEMHDYLQKELSKAKFNPNIYFKKLQSLAILYTQQLELDWTLLHSDEAMKRMSLPSYPFEKTNFWIRLKTPLITTLKKQKNILGQNLSAADLFHFELNLDQEGFYFSEHQVNQQKILAGVVIFEVLYDLTQFLFPNQSLLDVKEIHWLEPIETHRLNEKLSISLKPSADIFYFELTQPNENPKVFAKGKLQFFKKGTSTEIIDLTKLRRPFIEEYTKEDIYKRFSDNGLNYGPSFQTIVKAYRYQNEVLCEIRLAPKVIDSSEDWNLHPCLIDGALQSSALFFEQLTTVGYLYALEEVVFFQKLALKSTYYAHLQKREKGTISLKLYDETGRLSLSIAKIVIKTQDKPHIHLSCLETQWLESPLPSLEQTKPEKDARVLVITTLSEQEKRLRDSLVNSFSTEQTRVIEWSKMNELFKPGEIIIPNQIYILFNELFELNNLAEGMTRCAHELVLFLNLLAKHANLAELHLRFITINAFSATTLSSPIAAALTGLIHSFHQENPHTKISCIDVAPQQSRPKVVVGMIKNEPNQSQSIIIAIDKKAKRFIRNFNTHVFPKLDLMSFRTNGVYLIVGGANGVGFELSQFLAKNYQARIILVGRAPEVQQVHKIKQIYELGGAALYYQADVGDIEALAIVLTKVQKEYGRLNGVIHSALVLDDKPIDNIDLTSIESVLRPKVLGTINLCTLLKESTLDFLLLFSSAQSYMNNAGQSTYAMASIFQDLFAMQFRKEVTFPIKVVNWGYWGTVGAVVSDYYQQKMQKKGILSIEPEEAFQLLGQFLMSSLNDCVLLSATPTVIDILTTVVPDNQCNPSEFNEGFIALEQFTAQLLLLAFQKEGYFKDALLTYQLSQLLQSLPVQPSHQSLFLSILSILHQHRLIDYDKNLGLIKTLEPFVNDLEPLRQKLIKQYSYLNAHIELVCQCVASLFAVLNGQKRHTEVLFPDNQFQLVEKVYTLHPISKAITKQLMSYIISFVHESGKNSSSVPFNLLEIGAGTGSATVDILQALRANNLKINYIFTDLSEGFLQKARLNLGLNYEGIELKCLDISRDPREQGFEANQIDLVLANNVLHATGNIAASLAHIRVMLKIQGIVLINELTQTSNFLTATFGLTPGWWNVDQNEETIPHSPLLNLENWKSVLARLKFSLIQTPLLSAAKEETLAEAQQIIIATKLDSLEHSIMMTKSNEPNLAKLEEHLKTMFSEILRIPVSDLNSNVNLGDYGLDSLVTLEATARLKTQFNHFSNTVLFEHTTIEKLMNYLVENYAESLTYHFSVELNSTEVIELQTEHNLAKIPTQVVNGHDIAVIGFHGRFPGAETVEEFWDLLVQQKSAIKELPKERSFEAPEYTAGFLNKVAEFDAFAFNISPREAEKMDPQERVFLESCWELFERSGYTKTYLSTCDFNVGCFVGAMNTDYSLSTFRDNHRTQHHYSALWSIANRVSYFFNLTGPSLTIDTACASSLTAIHMACQSIRQGDCQLAIAGGVNLILHPNHFVMLAETKMLSEKKSCQPFSDDADGMIIGEGVGAILLKPLSIAIRDNDLIHAVIRGSHINSSGKTKGYMVPNPSVQETLMKATLKKAAVDISTISYIETQGTGTKLGDEIEIEALQRVYGSGAPLIGTLKPNIGHLESAAGIAGVIKILLQLQHKTLIPAINGKISNQSRLLKNSSFKLPEHLLEWQTQDSHPRRAAISAFGAGGSNAHMIIEEFPKTTERSKIKKPYYLLLISAKNDDSLTWGIHKLYHHLVSQSLTSLWDLSYTLAARREHFNYRCAFIVSSMKELLAILKEVTEGKEATQVWRSEGKIQIDLSIESSEVIEQLSRFDSENTATYFDSLALLAKLYVQGAEIKWEQLFQNQVCQLVALPTYSFMRQTYWSTQSAIKIEQLEASTIREEKAVNNQASIQDYLLTLISDILKISTDVLDATENLLEYGFDSISLAYLLTAIESHYTISLSPVIVMEYSTVASLASYLQAQIYPGESIYQGELCVE